MAKSTLLEMVQSIMSDMDSDEVTSINDTVEASQVASTIRDVYRQLIANETIPEHRSLGQLTASTPATTVFLSIPSTTKEVLLLKYNVQTVNDPIASYREIKYKSVPDFLDHINQNRPGDSNVEAVVDPTSSVTLYITNDAAPKFWTSFDDLNICFDSYDIAVDATGLVNTKTQIYQSVYPVFTLSDSFTPNIDENLFPYLLAESKATCFINLKQQANPKIDQQARRQKVKLQHGRFRTSQSEEDSLAPAQPSFGRGRP